MAGNNGRVVKIEAEVYLKNEVGIYLSMFCLLCLSLQNIGD